MMVQQMFKEFSSRLWFGGKKDEEVPSEPPSPVILSPEKLQKMCQVRQYIVGELYTTEKNYVTNLDIVLKQFREPLMRAALAYAAAHPATAAPPLPQSPVSPIAQSDSANALVASRSRITGRSLSDSNGNKRVSPLMRSVTTLQRNRRTISGSKHQPTFTSLSFNSSAAAQSGPKLIIPMVDIKIIFAWIEDLIAFNREFSEELESVVSQWERSERVWAGEEEGDTVSIGQLFLRYVRSTFTSVGLFLPI
jgi:hypothetical protein